MTTRKRKVRISAIIAATVTACSVLAGPAGVAIIGAKASGIAALAGVILQAVTKPAVRREHERT